jgi:hypothetical protein
VQAGKLLLIVDSRDLFIGVCGEINSIAFARQHHPHFDASTPDLHRKVSGQRDAIGSLAALFREPHSERQSDCRSAEFNTLNEFGEHRIRFAGRSIKV